MEASQLVGREGVLASLREGLGRAAAGRGGLVALVGEAGIGKSALADVWAADAAARGFEVVSGRAWELSDAPAWFPLWPCFESLGLPAPPPPQPDGGFHLWQRTLAALGTAAARRPVAWVLEDLHAADQSTLDLLTFVARPLRVLRAAVLVTTRPEPAGTDPRPLARLRREATEIVLPALAPAEVAELAARLAGRAPSGRALAELAARTGGNPFFVVECARAMRLGRPAEALPATVRQMVLERVRGLGPACEALLGDAAVLGRTFAAGLLAKMAGLLPARVIDDLGPALRARLLEEIEPGRFTFAHALVCEALLAGQPASERAAREARAAAALATLGDAPSPLVERAQHHLAAILHGGGPEGLEVVERAAAWLSAQGANDRALSLRRKVLAAREQGLLPPATLDELVDSSLLALSGGSFGESRRWSALAAELSPGQIDPELLRLLEEASAALPPEATALRVRVAARLAAAQQPSTRPEQPVQLAREAIAAARRLGDPAVLSDALFHGGSALVDYASDEEVLRVADELWAVATARGERARAIRASARVALAAGGLGDLARFHRAIDQALDLAREAGDARLLWRPLLLASLRALAAGQVDESERCIVEVRALGEATDDPTLALALVAHLGNRASTLDSTEEVRHFLSGLGRALIGHPTASSLDALIRGRALARLGDRAGAAEALARLPEVGDAALGSALVDGYGELVASAGSAERCERLRRRAQALRGRHLFSGHIGNTYEGPGERILGLLAAGSGKLDVAARDLEAAREIAARHGFRAWEARVAFELGQVLESAGEAERAAAARADAAALCDELGLRELGARVAASRPSAPAVAVAAAPPTAGPATCTREGPLWSVVWGDHAARVPGSRGMELLARLIGRPGEEVHVLALSSDVDAELVDGSDAPMLDEKARRRYARRLEEIAAELAGARLAGDAARRRGVLEEKAFLERELGRAVGHGGRDRVAGSVAERARINVQRRLKGAIQRIAEVDPTLGMHLQRGIRTGIYCTYRP